MPATSVKSSKKKHKQNDSPALRLEWRSPSELAENPANWRTHPEAQVAALTDVIAEVGWAGACLYNEATGRLIDGHARKKVALEQGSDKVPVLVGSWTEEQERKILATLDPLAAMAEADKMKLEELLRSVEADGNIKAMLDELAQQEHINLGANEPGDGGDDFDATPQEGPTRCNLGDLWIIGGVHRLLVGDCTVAENVAKLIGGDKPFLCVTDPPYGVNYDPQWRSDAAKDGHLAYAARRVGKVTNDDRADWGDAWKLTPCDVIYSWHPPGATSIVHAKALQDSGFVLRMQIIWAKSNFPIGRGDYHVRHEPCWYAVRDGVPAKRTDDRTQTTLWEINLDKNVEGGHSTQKPLECMARAIRNHECESVYDPFLGSGTTIIAAHRLGRRCFGCEIEPKYGDVILRRCEAEGMTVEKAT